MCMAQNKCLAQAWRHNRETGLECKVRSPITNDCMDTHAPALMQEKALTLSTCNVLLCCRSATKDMDRFHFLLQQLSCHHGFFRAPLGTRYLHLSPHHYGPIRRWPRVPFLFMPAGRMRSGPETCAHGVWGQGAWDGGPAPPNNTSKRPKHTEPAPPPHGHQTTAPPTPHAPVHAKH